MREKYIEINNLKVSETLLNFVNDELLKESYLKTVDMTEAFCRIILITMSTSTCI